MGDEELFPDFAEGRMPVYQGVKKGRGLPPHQDKSGQDPASGAPRGSKKKPTAIRPPRSPNSVPLFSPDKPKRAGVITPLSPETRGDPPLGYEDTGRQGGVRFGEIRGRARDGAESGNFEPRVGTSSPKVHRWAWPQGDRRGPPQPTQPTTYFDLGPRRPGPRCVGKAQGWKGRSGRSRSRSTGVFQNHEGTGRCARAGQIQRSSAAGFQSTRWGEDTILHRPVAGPRPHRRQPSRPTTPASL